MQRSERPYVAATRALYNASAQQYVDAIGTEISAAIEGPIDRAILSVFTEIVSQVPRGLVVDLGCGPGRVAAYLAERGVDVVGVDLSEAMVQLAGIAHPHIHFETGLMSALPFETATLRGAVCWYSIIHTPPDDLDEVFSELKRALQPNGDLLVAFQAGDGQAVVKTNPYGTDATLTSYRHNVNDIVQQLAGAGFGLQSTTVREPVLSHETVPQAFILARSACQSGA